MYVQARLASIFGVAGCEQHRHREASLGTGGLNQGLKLRVVQFKDFAVGLEHFLVVLCFCVCVCVYGYIYMCVYMDIDIRGTKTW